MADELILEGIVEFRDHYEYVYSYEHGDEPDSEIEIHFSVPYIGGSRLAEEIIEADLDHEAWCTVDLNGEMVGEGYLHADTYSIYSEYTATEEYAEITAPSYTSGINEHYFDLAGKLRELECQHISLVITHRPEVPALAQYERQRGNPRWIKRRHRRMKHFLQKIVPALRKAGKPIDESLVADIQNEFNKATAQA